LRLEPGIAEILGPRSPEPKILRVLWRMQGATRVTQVGTDTIAMGSSVNVGLAVSSHVNGTLATATFDHVTVTTY
jgi:hypothetical protein